MYIFLFVNVQNSLIQKCKKVLPNAYTFHMRGSVAEDIVCKRSETEQKFDRD